MPSSAAVLHVRHSPFSASRDRLQQRRARSELRASAPGTTLAAEGPSCLFVGPIETASKEMLEALYQQARDSYYSGSPLIVDDMFDKVELKLRVYGSKSVVKYPRCSLRRQSTYADAEEDPSQVFALASVWILLLVFGASAFLVPTIYTINLALKDASNSRDFLYNGRSPFESLTMLNAILFIGLGYLIGYPVASASVQALQGLWRNDLVALKGSCPNCGEEVFAFVRAEKSKQQPHRAECHVCESALVFRTKVEQSISGSGRHWVYGRVYLVPQTFANDRRFLF
ncbi:PGR5-like protein 1B, chloroplastic isoform X1 [Phoenix dactylifera]|uniref:PGR5-like protein 1B, chloroplastic isoform X1 n=1 Tax=Phoenix dactylifera TaxID=42345 RepID=A0A8B7BSX9_PHODC|nr:PGR5-like protein 1B, chloroplastic isoform X1 [Phoenix dactylifera]